jgi:hypothetical protein
MEIAIAKLMEEDKKQQEKNKAYEAKIIHLENIVEDLVGRIAKMEDKALQNETNNRRNTRSKATSEDTGLKEATAKLDEKINRAIDKISEIEEIVD